MARQSERTLSQSPRGRSASRSPTKRAAEGVRFVKEKERGEEEEPHLSETTSEEDEEYEVEQIVDKRVRFGRVEYKVKWLGYPESENTWQTVESMNCPTLVAQFEEKRGATPASKSRRNGKIRAASSPRSKARPGSGVGGGRRGRQLGRSLTPDKEAEAGRAGRGSRKTKTSSSSKWTPGDWDELVDHIDTVTRDKDVLLVWISWNDGRLTEELAAEANIRCPQKIIEFYESRLKFPGESK